MTSFRLTVPGNLLLAGEYAVLEEGGLGAALAVEPRLVVTVFPGEDWEVRGHWVGGTERWSPEQEGTPPFAGLVFLRALDLLEGRGDERGRRWSTLTPPARIELDSSAFFDSQGRKRGFGSSAALAAGMTAALARLGGREPEPSVHQIAVEAHRHAQGGAGSGYDVTVSWFGGLGLFVGGARPRWEPSNPGLLPPLGVFPGPEAVRTVGSIARYRSWKTTNPRLAADFLDASNAAVKSLVTAKTRTDLMDAWQQTKVLGLDMGTRVGSDAALADREPGTFVKALGAGNETGLVAFSEAPKSWPTDVTPLEISPEGLRWE